MFSELFITEKNDGQNYENKTHRVVDKKILNQYGLCLQQSDLGMLKRRLFSK